MNIKEHESEILVLSESDLTQIGQHVSGGDYLDSTQLSVNVLTLVGMVFGFSYWLMNPTNRRDCWNTFISNFKRGTVAAVAAAASDAATTPASARDDLGDIEIAATGPLSNAQSIEVILGIVDDPNEL